MATNRAAINYSYIKYLPLFISEKDETQGIYIIEKRNKKTLVITTSS